MEDTLKLLHTINHPTRAKVVPKIVICCTGPEHVELSARWLDIGVCDGQVRARLLSRVDGLYDWAQVCAY